MRHVQRVVIPALLIACGCSPTTEITIKPKVNVAKASASPSPAAATSATPAAYEAASTASPTPVTSATPMAAATTVASSATPTVTPTDTPTPSVGPTDGGTTGTSTPTPTPTDTPTPVPTATPTPANPTNLTVTTLAGGTAGYADGSGTGALFNTPGGLALRPDGALVLADAANQRIRLLTTGGAVTTLAGSGATGFGNGTLDTASFNGPHGVAAGADGTVYVADTNNQVIRALSATSGAVTYAGTGLAGFADGLLGAAQFNGPTGLAMTSGGDLWVSDTGNHAIRKISSLGSVTTPAGAASAGFIDGDGSSARFSSPGDLVVGPTGLVYVADTGNHAVRVYDPASNQVRTLAGGGSPGLVDANGSSARFNAPVGLALAADGSLYVADTGNHALRKVTSDGTVTTLMGGTAGLLDGPAVTALFDGPSHLLVTADGALYVVDTLNQRLRKVS